jgi:hypothetical protein
MVTLRPGSKVAINRNGGVNDKEISKANPIDNTCDNASRISLQEERQ